MAVLNCGWNDVSMYKTEFVNCYNCQEEEFHTEMTKSNICNLHISICGIAIITVTFIYLELILVNLISTVSRVIKSNEMTDD